MFCKICGKENDNQSQFCTGCGHSMVDEVINNTSQPVEQPINQEQVVNIAPQNSFEPPTQDAGAFSASDVHQITGQSKKKKWLNPVIAVAAALIVGVVVYLVWPKNDKSESSENITESVVDEVAVKTFEDEDIVVTEETFVAEETFAVEEMSAEEYLAAALLNLADPEDFMLLPSLKNESKKAFSLSGDFIFADGIATAGFEWLYDKEGKQIQLTAGIESEGETILEDISVYLTPEILALYMKDISDEFSYLKLNLDTLPEDWNESVYAKESGVEIPDMDIRISEYVEMLFSDMTSMTTEELFGSDKDLIKIYDEFMDSVTFEDEGEKEIKVAEETINTSVLSYTVSGDALKTFILDYMDFSMNLTMKMYGELLGAGASGYGMDEYYTQGIKEVFDMIEMEDMTISFFIDSSDNIRRIVLPLEMSMMDDTYMDAPEVIEMYIQMDLMGEKYPLDSFELTFEVDGETLVVKREGIKGDNSNSDYWAIYDGITNETLIAYEMTWDKAQSFFEMQISAEDVEIILGGTIEVMDDKILFNDMLLTYEDMYWQEVTTIAEFSMEIGYVDPQAVFHDVNDSNSKNLLDLTLTELEELIEKFFPEAFLETSEMPPVVY